MSPYIETATQITVTASQIPPEPTAMEWLAIMGARAWGIWVEPGDWVVRYPNGTVVGVSGGSVFDSQYTAA